jgi:hypothetical protein
MAEGLSVADAERWIRKSDEGWRTDTGRFAIVDDSSGQFLGQVGLAVSWDQLSGEIYYWLARRAPEILSGYHGTRRKAGASTQLCVRHRGHIGAEGMPFASADWPVGGCERHTPAGHSNQQDPHKKSMCAQFGLEAIAVCPENPPTSPWTRSSLGNERIVQGDASFVKGPV